MLRRFFLVVFLLVEKYFVLIQLERVTKFKRFKDLFANTTVIIGSLEQTQTGFCNFRLDASAFLLQTVQLYQQLCTYSARYASLLCGWRNDSYYNLDKFDRMF